MHFGGLDVPLLTVLLPLAHAHRKATGIRLRGWSGFARAIERRFLELGGIIHYGSRAASRVVEGGVARAIQIEDGARYAADRILSAVDGRFTETVLLGIPESECAARFAVERLSDQPVQVNLGVAESFDGEDGALTVLLPERPRVAGREQTRITLHNKACDPASAPPGETALTVFLEPDCGFWESLRSDRARYDEEKRRRADLVIDVVARDRPGFRERVEVVDVSTPLTRERFTGNCRGAMQARRAGSSIPPGRR